MFFKTLKKNLNPLGYYIRPPTPTKDGKILAWMILRGDKEPCTILDIEIIEATLKILPRMENWKPSLKKSGFVSLKQTQLSMLEVAEILDFAF